MAEDVPDYLSDEFLVDCVPDIRPGLIHQRAEKRKHEQLKRQDDANKQNMFRNKSRKQMEEDGRQDALQKEIPSDNKGFMMLQKMGYKPGTSLGKGMDGIKCPIGVEVKTNRKGLGHKVLIKENKAKLAELKVTNEVLLGDFRQRLQLATAQKEILRDLRRAQTTCQSLDINQGKISPVESWYWPEVPKEKEDCDTVSDDDQNICESLDENEVENTEELMVEPSEQLKLLVHHLRETYQYCLWCGICYDSKDDFALSCPGDKKEDH